MDLKKTLRDQALKLAQHPKVIELATNPAVMETAMKAMALRGQVASTVSAASQSVVRSLNLATRDDVRELRRTIRRLEEELDEARSKIPDDRGGA